MKPQLIAACDFDGTVTRQDTLVEILNAYGAPDWRKIQDRVVSGEISIRQGLEEEMATVRATPKELKGLLAAQVEIEPTFLPFLSRARAKGVPVILLTGGFDFCVEAVLSRENLTHLPYLSNRLHPPNGTGEGISRFARNDDIPQGWRVEFPFPSLACQDCGYCKADPIRLWNEQGYTTVFIGNGVTDRCPARQAGLTFAKDELADWCRRQGISHAPFETFRDVEEELRKRSWL